MVPYILNLLDLALTFYALSIGCTELNPLIQSVPFMVAYKVIIVGVLLWWLSRQRERLARYALYIATVVYGAVCLWHAIGIWMMMS